MRERLAYLSLRLGPPIGVGLVLGLIGPFGTFDLLPTTPSAGLLVGGGLRELAAGRCRLAATGCGCGRPDADAGAHGAASRRLPRRGAGDRCGGAGQRALGDRLARRCRGPVRAGAVAARGDLAAGLHVGGHARADCFRGRPGRVAVRLGRRRRSRTPTASRFSWHACLHLWKGGSSAWRCRTITSSCTIPAGRK